MRRYPLIATVVMFIIVMLSAMSGDYPNLGFWGYFWYFIFGSLFMALGAMGGELVRRFIHPDVLMAEGAGDMLKKRLFWKFGPQCIGAVIGSVICGSFMNNVLGYYVG